MRWFAAGVVCVAALVFSGVGMAATYTHNCPPTDDSCAALAERIEQLDADTIANAPLPPEPAGPISGTVALSSDDADRLDLAWRGVWFLTGAVLVLMLGPLFVKAFRFWR
jgi:hypothetical protein